MNMVKKIIVNADEIISGMFLSVTVCLVIINVLLRYVFNTGIFWSVEVATICFVWSVFIGASACYRRKMHIGIDIIIKLASKNVQRILNIVVKLLLVIINAYITYLAVVFVRASAIKPTAILGISSAYVSASLIVGFGLMSVYAIHFFIQDVRSAIMENKEQQSRI